MSNGASNYFRRRAKTAHVGFNLRQRPGGMRVVSFAGYFQRLVNSADSLDQLSAVVKAISEKAKISGLLVQKMEVGGAGDFEKCETTEAVVDELLHYSLNPYHAVTDADRQGLIALFKHHMQEVDDFIASIKSRPINGVSQRLHDLEQDRIGRHRRLAVRDR